MNFASDVEICNHHEIGGKHHMRAPKAFILFIFRDIGYIISVPFINKVSYCFSKTELTMEFYSLKAVNPV